MEKITKFDIATLQKRFRLNSARQDFFLVETENYSTLPTEPYRTETYGIGLYRKGSIKLKTGLITHIVQGPSIIVMGPSVIRSWEQMEDDPRSSILFFNESYLLKNNTDVFFLKGFDFFENNNCHVIKLNESELNTFEIIFSSIRTLLGAKHWYEAEIVRSYIYILIYESDAVLKSINAVMPTQENSHHRLVNSFKSILSIEFKKHRNVAFYAEKLNLTPKHFSEKLKELTGKTAGEWIDEMVLLEAKVLLQDQSLSISQISDKLSFSSPSTFGKFFKTNTGVSPVGYRKSIH